MEEKSESFGSEAEAYTEEGRSHISIERMNCCSELFLPQTHAAAVFALVLYLREFYRSTFSWSQENEELLCVV